MPRVMRRSRTRRAGVTPEHVRKLLTGHAFCGHAGDLQGFDTESLRILWTELRDELLPTWIRDSPGSRPWAFWQFDAPEQRRCVNGVHPFDNAGRKAIVAGVLARPAVKPDHVAAVTGLYFGIPRAWFPETGDFDCDYEDEADYLERLGLLEPSELAALACGTAGASSGIDAG